MNCKQAEEYLVEYLYQELSPKKTLEIEKHLRSCAQCAKTLESWQAIHRGYQRSTEEPQIAPYFKQKILAAAEEELQRAPSWKDRILLGLKIVTVPIAIFLIVILFNQKEKSPDIAMQKQKQVEPAPVRPAPQAVPQIAEGGYHQESDKDEARRQDSSALRNEQSVLDKMKAAPESRAEEKLARDQEQEDAKKELNQPQIMPSNPAPEAAPPPSAEAPAAGAERPAQQQVEKQQAPMKSAEITTVSKTNPNAPFWQGQTMLQKNDTKAGVERLKGAIAQDDSKELANEFYETGITYQNKGDYKNAIIQYKLLETNYPNYQYIDNVLFRLGDSYAEIGQYVEAVKAYNQVSAGQQKVARERIQQLEKKREAQEQLKALGYVGDSNKQ